MTHPNFLPLPLKHQLARASKTRSKVLKPSVKIKDKAFLATLFILIAAAAYWGYPLADAAYRAYKLYPIARAAQSAFQAGNFDALYREGIRAQNHIKELGRDAHRVSALRFIPPIESFYYTMQGSEKLSEVFIPVLKILSNTDGHVHDVPVQVRRDIITHLAAQSENLKSAATDLKRGGTFFLPEKLEHSLTAFEKFADISSNLPSLLGVSRERRYLVIFANNLEIRPAGGFIGTYALATVKDGEIADFSVRDSYNLPGARNFSLGPAAPSYVQRYLGIRGFPFRDINWWPDYPTSAKALKEQYIREGGEYGHELAGVITFSTEILKSTVDLTGPVAIDDIIFSRDNAVGELQKQVEITFWDQGIPVTERKDIVGKLAATLYQKIEGFNFEKNVKFAAMLSDLSDRRHAAYYFEDQGLQSLVAEQGWDGKINPETGDSFMVVDANLVGYKTEPLMTKKYNYKLREDRGKLVATLTLDYRHRATFATPLVNNYRTYTRVYAPLGSRLLSASIPGVETTQESGRTVFGVLHVVPIGEERKATFVYELPTSIPADDSYALSVEKQIGAYPLNLQLDIDFGNVKKQIRDITDTNKTYSF